MFTHWGPSLRPILIKLSIWTGGDILYSVKAGMIFLHFSDESKNAPPIPPPHPLPPTLVWSSGHEFFHTFEWSPGHHGTAPLKGAVRAQAGHKIQLKEDQFASWAGTGRTFTFTCSENFHSIQKKVELMGEIKLSSFNLKNWGFLRKVRLMGGTKRSLFLTSLPGLLNISCPTTNPSL